MTDLMLPAFWDFPEESKIIGRLLAGYGELEFELGLCLGPVLGDDALALKMLFRTRGEEQRIQIADSLMRAKYEGLKLKDPYCEAIADMSWCRKVRNQYAHCQWHGDATEGLSFIDMESWAKQHNPGSLTKKPLNLTLLVNQEAYFKFVQRCLWHLMDRAQSLVGKSPIHQRPLPKKLNRPPQHNGPQ